MRRECSGPTIVLGVCLVAGVTTACSAAGPQESPRDTPQVSASDGESALRYTITTDRNLRVKMRDGVELSTDRGVQLLRIRGAG